MKESFRKPTSSDPLLHLGEQTDGPSSEGIKPKVGPDLLRYKTFSFPAWEISPANVDNMV